MMDTAGTTAQPRKSDLICSFVLSATLKQRGHKQQVLVLASNASHINWSWMFDSERVMYTWHEPLILSSSRQQLETS